MDDLRHRVEAVAIVDCGGKYEVHPGASGGWAVVNGEAGSVRCEFRDRDKAIGCAEALNAE